MDSHFIDPILDELERDIDAACDFAKTQGEVRTFMTEDDFFEPEREEELHTAAKLRKVMAECDGNARRIFDFRNSLGVKLLTQTVSKGYRELPSYTETGINWKYLTDPERIRAQIRRMIAIVRNEESYDVDEDRSERIMTNRKKTDEAMKDIFHIDHPNGLVIHPAYKDYEIVNIFGAESREVEEITKNVREKGWTLFYVKRPAWGQDEAVHVGYGIGNMIQPFFYMDEVGCGVYRDFRRDFARQMIKCVYHKEPNKFAGIGDVALNVDEAETTFIEKLEEEGFMPVSRIMTDERPSLLMHYDKRSVR